MDCSNITSQKIVYYFGDKNPFVPTEILARIFENCDFNDSSFLASVSTSWSSIVASTFKQKAIQPLRIQMLDSLNKTNLPKISKIYKKTFVDEQKLTLIGFSKKLKNYEIRFNKIAILHSIQEFNKNNSEAKHNDKLENISILVYDIIKNKIFIKFKDVNEIIKKTGFIKHKDTIYVNIFNKSIKNCEQINFVYAKFNISKEPYEISQMIDQRTILGDDALKSKVDEVKSEFEIDTHIANNEFKNAFFKLRYNEHSNEYVNCYNSTLRILLPENNIFDFYCLNSSSSDMKKRKLKLLLEFIDSKDQFNAWFRVVSKLDDIDLIYELFQDAVSEFYKKGHTTKALTLLMAIPSKKMNQEKIENIRKMLQENNQIEELANFQKALDEIKLSEAPVYYF